MAERLLPSKRRKLGLVVDVLGLLLAVLVHAASVQDHDGAALAFEPVMGKHPTL